ncbi:MAG TPA: hypothetical protein DCS93_07555 [Microscillaceae bacterium]|nr:hypothetical protein [Microscillaceae bacterium]
MDVLEIVLLIIAYTAVIPALFLEIICYKRNLEAIETIHFTGSLLILILSITLTYFFTTATSPDLTSIFLYESMALVALTTPLNVFEERSYSVKPIIKKSLIGFVGILMILIPVGYFIKIFTLVEYVVTIFLGTSVVFSMLIIKTTKPKIQIAHREKIERYLANAFLIFIPLSFVANYIAYSGGVNIRIGFTIPLIFILMAGSKLWDDIQRLSLFKPIQEITTQNLTNYALTKREKEVALLLMKGNTYRQIAEQLFVSIPTVKTHTYNIYKKCNVHNRIELITLLNN